MTTQEAYEAIREYFTRPGARLAKEDQADELGIRRCRYRTDDGRACAVGCLIPDEFYRPEMEGRSALYVVETLRAVFYGVSERFLQKAQHLHDGTAQTAEEFVDLLDDLAAHHRLRVVGSE